jgi:hypothetical protein
LSKRKSTWVEDLSYYGLMQPSHVRLEQAEHVHKFFDKVLSTLGFHNGQNLVKRLINIFMIKNATYCREVVNFYELQRMFIMIKNLNMEIKLSATQTQTDGQKLSKLQTKMKRVVCKKINL